MSQLRQFNDGHKRNKKLRSIAIQPLVLPPRCDIKICVEFIDRELMITVNRVTAISKELSDILIGLNVGISLQSANIIHRIQTDFILLNGLLLQHLPTLRSFNLNFLFSGDKQQSESRLLDYPCTLGIYKAFCYTAQLKHVF